MIMNGFIHAYIIVFKQDIDPSLLTIVMYQVSKKIIKSALTLD
jgi:hypothetical protein